ncbi:MAG: hypothetical protein GY841_16160 [FCB group bacterium]|nr:hypothetical protein [FCB group bacterium]
MAVMTTAAFAKFMWPGVNSAYGMSYKEYPLEYPNFFKTYNSTKNYEEDQGLSGFGQAIEKPEGTAITYDDATQAFVDRYTHVTYGLGFIVTRENIEDWVGPGKAINKATALGHSMRNTEETLGSLVLDRSFTSTYSYGDGKELCATDHPNQAGGTWSNEAATASDLSEAAIEQAFTDIGLFKDDRGLQIPVNAKKLIVHYSGLPNAHRLLHAKLRPTTSDNDPNWTKDSGMFPEGVFGSHFTSDVDSWWIITDCPNGMKHYSRRKPEFKIDDDFDTENSKFKATFRSSYGCTDKRGIYGVVGAS